MHVPQLTKRSCLLKCSVWSSHRLRCGQYLDFHIKICWFIVTVCQLSVMVVIGNSKFLIVLKQMREHIRDNSKSYTLGLTVLSTCVLPYIFPAKLPRFPYLTDAMQWMRLLTIWLNNVHQPNSGGIYIMYSYIGPHEIISKSNVWVPIHRQLSSH